MFVCNLAAQAIWLQHEHSILHIKAVLVLLFKPDSVKLIHLNHVVHIPLKNDYCLISW